MLKASRRGVARLIDAVGYSCHGLAACFRNEAAFRQEVALCVLLIPLAVWLGENGIERSLLIGSLLLVLTVELLNSCVEAVVDRTGCEFHELAGRAKDMGSAAVLISLINAGLIWVLVVFS